MRIGINASFLRKPGTGIGQATQNVLRTLISNSQFPISNFQKSEFFLYCDEKPQLPFTLPENFQIRAFLPFWKRDDILRKWLWERQVPKEAAKDRCDVFLSLYQAATKLESRITNHESGKIRHVMVVHDIIPELFPEYLGKLSQRLHWQTVKRAIRKADAIIAVSESTKCDLVQLGIPKEKITRIYEDAAPSFREPVSEDSLSRVLQKYNLKPGYIYHGGGLEVRKNTERLLRAYAKLLKNKRPTTDDRRPDTEIPPLVISGKIFDTTNKLATDVKGLVKELHLEGKARLLGFVPDEDLPALYRGALFFVYPSLYEGFGLPVLEALCQGVPVLCSDRASLPEVGGKAALYVDPASIEALTSQMERLLADEALRKALISESASQAAKFDWGLFVRKIMATLMQ